MTSEWDLVARSFFNSEPRVFNDNIDDDYDDDNDVKFNYFPDRDLCLLRGERIKTIKKNNKQ